ncbi:MAG: helix-turn-helix domain-containing protein [Lachnospiraceae bacterium]|nr:helix-turn-helix domain-containing protein [Lachnospiraceae bacterium]
MTFGEKLYKLRKSQGLSQEALAEKLNTSRQAVSKWENNNGYPETEKIILIGKIFQVSLDDLLIDDRAIDSDNGKRVHEEAQGFYVSRETANGFLLYYKRKFLLLATACGIALGCNSISYTSTEHYFFASRVTPILTTISIMLFLSIVIYIALKQNPYRVLRKKELVFAEDVRKEIQVEFLKMKKMLVGGIALGLLIFVTIGSGWELPVFESMKYMDILFCIIFSMILSGIGSFITFFCIGIYWSYSILLRNQHEKSSLGSDDSENAPHSP